MKVPKIIDSTSFHPISRVKQQNKFLPRQNYGVSKISRLPYKILQSLIIVVSEWRKGQLKKHYSVTAEQNFVRMRTERTLSACAQREGVVGLHSRCLAHLHGQRWLNNSWSTVNLHLGLAFERKPYCTNMHCSWMFTCLFQASSFLIG